jgi:hypothetical protein
MSLNTIAGFWSIQQSMQVLCNSQITQKVVGTLTISISIAFHNKPNLGTNIREGATGGAVAALIVEVHSKEK